MSDSPAPEATIKALEGTLNDQIRISVALRVRIYELEQELDNYKKTDLSLVNSG